MNRIIKFRAFWKDTLKEVDGSEDGYNYPLWDVSDDDMYIMQFTGLLDKNGTEIYEGDIVEFLKSTRTGEVVSLVVKWFQYSGHQGWWPNEIEDMSVIGNIYENPELLKEVK